MSKSTPYEVRSDTTGPDCVPVSQCAQSGLHTPGQYACGATAASAKASRSSARAPIAPADGSDRPGTERSEEEQRPVHSESQADEAVSQDAVATGREVILWTAPETETPPATNPVSNTVLGYGPTLGDIIDQYQTDPLSSFHKLRYPVRINSRNLLRRIRQRHGHMLLSEITGRTLVEWHALWSCNGEKLATGHAFVAQLRTIFGFGFALLAEPECRRMSEVMGKLRFPHAPAPEQRMTIEQADAIRTWAHIIGWHSIALAQAFQWECMIRQKDAIGEWVPETEGIASDIAWNGKIWHRGFRWSEIDDNLILRHVTSKRQKPIVVDLKLAPMVMEELEFIGELPSDNEPIIICETNGMPYTDSEFRRKYRIVADYAGVPPDVFNMLSRSGAISEAFDAGADPDRIRKTATHSNLAMSQRYNRGDYLEAASDVQNMRVASRRAPDGDVRDAKWHQIDTTSVKRSSAKHRRKA